MQLFPYFDLAPLEIELLLLLLLGVETVVLVDLHGARDDIGHDERVRPARVEEPVPLLLYIDVVPLLVDLVVELFEKYEFFLFLHVGPQVQVNAVNEPPDPRFLHHLEELLILWRSPAHQVELPPGFVARLLTSHPLPGLLDQPVAEEGLLSDKTISPGLELVVLLGGNHDGAGNDERRTGLINEDRIHLIDYGEKMPPLHLLLRAHSHPVVPEIVEAELAVRPVGDVALVSGLALVVRNIVFDASDGEAEKFINLSHPLGISTRQIIVHGHEINVLSRKRVEV